MKKKMMTKNDVKKLYHITLGTPTELTPRVPKNRLKEEDGITPRICVCPSIEDCFKGAYWTVGYYEKWKYDGQDRELVRVLEFDIDCIGKENIIDSEPPTTKLWQPKLDGVSGSLQTSCRQLVHQFW